MTWKILTLSAALVLAFLPFSVTSATAQDAFGYTCETCPANWPNLNIVNNNCGGPDQSPIAFSKGDARFPWRLARLKVNYGDLEVEEEEKATNIEWPTTEPGQSTVKLKETTYNFIQFHFHSTAEHVINGERSNLEMHFVNQAEDGSLLVLAVFIGKGAENAAFAPIIESIETSEEQSFFVDLGALLPRNLRSFRYIGSTTTPPCTGGVQWILLKKQVELSPDQIEEIQNEIRGLNGGFDNNRTIQNREGRKIKFDFRLRRIRHDDNNNYD